MKPVLKTFAVAVLLAASQSALSQGSPFPSSGEAIDRQLPPFDTYADQHARNGTSMASSSGSPFPSAGEAIDRSTPPLDTYADWHARNGKVMASSGSPFPAAADVLDQPALDTYADRYAREHAAPSSAELDSAKLSISLGSRS